MPSKQPWKRKPLNHAPIYERQDDESDPAWSAFQLYRDKADTRSVSGVARECQKNASLISRWSQAWSWDKRVHAYDNHMEGVKRRAMEQEVEKMVKRHIALFQMGQTALSKVQEALLKNIQADPDFLRALSPRELVQANTQVAAALKTLTEGERQARGLDTEHVKVTGELTVDAIRAAYAKRVKAQAGPAEGDEAEEGADE